MILIGLCHRDASSKLKRIRLFSVDISQIDYPVSKNFSILVRTKQIKNFERTFSSNTLHTSIFCQYSLLKR
jgi:hypothetical protein